MAKFRRYWCVDLVVSLAVSPYNYAISPPAEVTCLMKAKEEPGVKIFGRGRQAVWAIEP